MSHDDDTAEKLFLILKASESSRSIAEGFVLPPGMEDMQELLDFARRSLADSTHKLRENMIAAGHEVPSETPTH